MTNAVLHDAVRIGDALMLPEMLHPRVQKERLDQPVFIASIPENSPSIGTIAFALGGDAATAHEAYRKLVALSEPVGPARPELVEANSYLTN